MRKQENTTKIKKQELSLKEKMLNLKQKAMEIKDNLVEKTATKIASSSLVIKDKKQLEEIIKSTIPKEFISKETQEKKIFKRYAIIIFIKKDSDFYKEALVEIPVLATKAWTQNIPLKITDLEYDKVKEFPSLVVFENKKIYKILPGEENIKKIVKNIDFDIIKLIENLSDKK